jgi:hypothetical protein
MGHEEENRSIAKAFVGLAVILWLIISIVASVLAQVDDESELAKKTQNPVADLISVPLQNNFNFDAVTIPYWTKVQLKIFFSS